MYSDKQEGESEKVTASYVTASRSYALLKLKKFPQIFEKKITKQNCWREILSFSRRMHLSNVSHIYEKPQHCFVLSCAWP